MTIRMPPDEQAEGRQQVRQHREAGVRELGPGRGGRTDGHGGGDRDTGDRRRRAR